MNGIQLCYFDFLMLTLKKMLKLVEDLIKCFKELFLQKVLKCPLGIFVVKMFEIRVEKGNAVKEGWIKSARKGLYGRTIRKDVETEHCHETLE